MALLTGDVVPLNTLDPMMHAITADILVKQGRKVVATGTVSESGFSIELPDGLEGEIEIHLGLHNAAPSLATANGEDMHVTLLYNNVNNFLA